MFLYLKKSKGCADLVWYCKEKTRGKNESQLRRILEETFKSSTVKFDEKVRILIN